MKTRRITTMIAALAVVAGLGLGPAPALGQDDTEKLDKISLADGREFEGNILDESDTTVTMEVVFRGIKTTREFRKREIIEILHDTIRVERDHRETTTAEVNPTDLSVRDRANGRRIVHLIPLRGLVGWQVYEPNIEQLWEQAVEAGVQTVVFEFDCYDGISGNVIETYRDMLQEIKEEAKENEIELVIWMKNAIGPAVAFALMFENIYVHPDAVMGRGEVIDAFLKERFDDESVRAKMISAWVGIYRGMAEEGGHDALLCEAMIRPEKLVGVRFEGETPIFNENPQAEGYTPLDVSEEEAIEFDADKAIRFGIAKGRRGGVRTFENLMDELDYREYYHYEGEAIDFTEAWIRGYDDAWHEYFQILADIEQRDAWDVEPAKKLGMKLQLYREIQRLLRRFPPLGVPPYGAVSNWSEYRYGVVDPYAIEFTIEDLKRQMQSIKEQEREQRRGPDG